MKVHIIIYSAYAKAHQLNIEKLTDEEITQIVLGHGNVSVIKKKQIEITREVVGLLPLDARNRVLKQIRHKYRICYINIVSPEKLTAKREKKRELKLSRGGMSYKKWRGQYNRYIKSPIWSKKRKEAFLFHGKFCHKCTNTTNLQVHHLTYENIFNEKMEDLMILCKPCHKRVHEKNYKKKAPKETKGS